MVDVDKTLSDMDLQSKNAWSLMAGIYSWLTCPLLCPLYGMILIFTLSLLKFNPDSTKLIISLIILGINTVLPILLIILLKMLHIIEDVALNNQKERALPYAIVILCMFGSAFFLWTRNAPMWVMMFFAGGGVAGLINLLVNRWWKISAHAAGMAGIVAMLVHLSRIGTPQTDMIPFIIGSIVAAGLLGTCRVYLGRHTFWQVMAGTFVGFSSVYLMMSINFQ